MTDRQDIPHQKRRLRGAPAINAARTHCEHGHPFDAANTYYWYGNRWPRRMCRQCNKDRQRERSRRLRDQREQRQP